jgi:hypothetical protein
MTPPPGLETLVRRTGNRNSHEAASRSKNSQYNRRALQTQVIQSSRQNYNKYQNLDRA